MTNAPALSIVIPTYNRPALAADAVVSILNGSPSSSFEIIVVDDGSVPPIELPPLAHTLLVRQANIGLNAARNAGVTCSRASVVAFLDDDVWVDGGWVDAVLDCFQDPRVGAMGGRISLAMERDCPSWLDLDRFGGYLSRLELGQGRTEMNGAALPFGANCAVRRRVFDEVGGFIDRLDRHNDSLLSGGDVEFFARVRAAGYTVTYESAAGVRHRIDDERLTKRYLDRRAFGQGQTDVLLHAISHGSRPPAKTGQRDLVSALVKALVTRPNRRRFAQRLWYHYLRGRRAAARARSPEPSLHTDPQSITDR